MKDHQATISAVQTWDEKAEVYANGYRAVCPDCPRWRGRMFSLEQRRLAEAQAQDHHAYHQHVARLTAPREEVG